MSSPKLTGITNLSKTVSFNLETADEAQDIIAKSTSHRNCEASAKNRELTAKLEYFFMEKKLDAAQEEIEHSLQLLTTSCSEEKLLELRKLTRASRKNSVRQQSVRNIFRSSMEQSPSSSSSSSTSNTKTEQSDDDLFRKEKTASAETLYEIGMQYLYGVQVEKNFDKAFNNLKQAASLGLSKAFCPLAYLYKEFANASKQRDVQQENLKKSFEAAMRAAKLGIAEGEYKVGVFFEQAWIHREPNTEEAKKWYQKSADQGYIYAKVALERFS